MRTHLTVVGVALCYHRSLNAAPGFAVAVPPAAGPLGGPSALGEFRSKMYALGAASEGGRLADYMTLNYPGSVMQCD